jgi:hypothetical protein
MRAGRKSVLSAVLPIVIATAIPALPLPVKAQGLDLVPGADIGGFSIGTGAYQAPDEATSDSGVYSFARYEIGQFEFEIDYGLTDEQFFLGAADYLFSIPTAEGVTGAKVALGGGVTFVNSDPVFDDAKAGPNFLGLLRFMDVMAVQLRYDLLGESSNLWTFGLSYSFF